MRQLQITLLFLILICMCTTATIGFNFTTCKEAERKALLNFKHSFFLDPLNRLGSWVGQDCCNWKGVGCDNVTGDVIKLDLGGGMREEYLEAREVNPALLELKYLTYLDLSLIYFNGSTFPELFGSMRQLQHLNLSSTHFSGKLPRILGNLTELVVLDLHEACSWICELERNSLEWAFKLENLQYLDLSYSNLSQTLDSLNLLHKLPSLSVLNLAGCGLGDSHQLLRNSTISSSPLQHLDLSSNYFIGPIPHFIQNLSSIRYLDLSYNHFNASIPSWMANKAYLRYLTLSHNNFDGPFPHFIQRLSFLTHLDLSYNQFSTLIPSWLANKTYLEYLDLSYNNFNRVDGGITSIIGHLCRLIHLDLSYNQFQEEVSESHVNFSRCSKYDLEYLDMQNTNISGYLPIIGNLSSLQTLDLSHNRLESLPPSLDLSHNIFGPLPDNIGNAMPSLRSLRLASNHINGSIPRSLCGLTHLQVLDLQNNRLSGLIPDCWVDSQLFDMDLSSNRLSGPIPNSLLKASQLQLLSLNNNSIEGELHLSMNSSTTLTVLDLGKNNLHGEIPAWNGAKFPSLQAIILQENRFKGRIPLQLCSFHALKIIDLASNNLSGGIPQCFGHFKGMGSMSNSRASNDDNSTVLWSDVEVIKGKEMEYTTVLHLLAIIDLSCNHLVGVIPAEITSLSLLLSLNLSHNHLNGTIPMEIGKMKSLESLDLSSNMLSGPLPNSLLKASQLVLLSLNNNSIEGPLPDNIGNATPSLGSLWLGSNHINGSIPRSLCGLAGLQVLDLQKNRLSGLIPDCWADSQISDMDLSSNRLSGPIPNSLLKASQLRSLSLNNNSIEGPLPDNIGNAMPSLLSLRLASNHINGSIPRSLCGLTLLQVLDLQKNRLSRLIPDCWADSRLVDMDLSSNRLSGPIPNSMWKASRLELLSLNNNSIEGELPLSMSNSTKVLRVLNVGKNNLHGEIPAWNGAKFPSLQVIILRENRFKGRIPLQLCSFHALKIIDLASNNLSGGIPQCFGHFKGMGPNSSASPPSPNSIASPTGDQWSEWSAVEVIKGKEREYTTILHLLVNMDLSCNHLVGVIPADITSLSLLFSLNLSHNHLNGTMPKEMGKMKSLESLDLSFNNLSGSIPESISSLDTLSAMNFSFNNLHGQIPIGRHFQTLDDPSIYMGNPGLCGDPLPKCYGGDTAHPPTSTVLEDEEGDDKHEKIWFYLVIMSGFSTGFWGVIGMLVVNKNWRHAYFGIAEELADWIYVKVAVRIARANKSQRMKIAPIRGV